MARAIFQRALFVGASAGLLLTSLVFLLLVVLWGAVFGPAILRARQETSPIATVGTFRRGLRALSRNRTARGRWVLVPKNADDLAAPHRLAIIRRRRVFVGLLASSGFFLVAGLLPGLRDLLLVHLGIDCLLGAFVIHLMQLKEADEAKHSYRPPIREMEEEYLDAVGEGSSRLA